MFLVTPVYSFCSSLCSKIPFVGTNGFYSFTKPAAPISNSVFARFARYISSLTKVKLLDGYIILSFILALMFVYYTYTILNTEEDKSEVVANNSMVLNTITYLYVIKISLFVLSALFMQIKYGDSLLETKIYESKYFLIILAGIETIVAAGFLFTLKQAFDSIRARKVLSIYSFFFSAGFSVFAGLGISLVLFTFIPLAYASYVAILGIAGMTIDPIFSLLTIKNIVRGDSSKDFLYHEQAVINFAGGRSDDY